MYTRIKPISDFIALCQTGWELGLHERNGGNLSYRLNQEEEAACAPLFSHGSWTALPEAVSELAGCSFLFTASGSYMQNIVKDPLHSMGIIRLDESGSRWRTLWGFVGGGKPTSELISHLLCHRAAGASRPVMYHCHPAALIAMSHILPMDHRVFTDALWRSMTECPIAVPEGVGVLPWITPGSVELGRATAALLERFSAVVWAMHGLFCCAPGFDEAIGIAHTLEKTAGIYIKVKSTGMEPVNRITAAQLLALSEAYHLGLDESMILQ